MSTTEIVLLVIGGLFFAISFFLPDTKKDEEKKITEDEIRDLVNKEMDAAKIKIDDMVEETVNYSIEKTERALERLSNEKIMAVDEYSETVLKKINDNHNEAVFLYDMLNDKDEKLKNTGEELKVSKTELEKERKDLEEKKKKVDEEIKQKEEKVKEEEALKEEAIEEPKAEEVVEAPTFTPFVPEHLKIVDGVAVVDKDKEKKTVVKKAPAKKPAVSKTVTPTENPASIDVHLSADNVGRKNSNEMIRKLHEQGKSNMQIAKELGLGVGEVKLVIDLFSSKKSK
ncbi:MAG: hypothetical protein J6Y09_06295 [Lachnospiraceae bacterium]|nr:hypothetical protein [Lachnospiraceae bacterium]